ncbi:MAG TPA: FmdB family zinc ribbon protein [Ktedonobacterales bacterium]|jgi:putative FmdB family regulatory protein
MPTYEYACSTCGARFETWQKMSDDPLTTCPTCGAAIHRVLFPAGIVFKGGGFYSTDHRHEGGAKAEHADTAEKSDKADKAGTPAATTATSTNGSSGSSSAGGSTGGSSGTATSGASQPAAAPPKD